MHFTFDFHVRDRGVVAEWNHYVLVDRAHSNSVSETVQSFAFHDVSRTNSLVMSFREAVQDLGIMHSLKKSEIRKPEDRNFDQGLEHCVWVQLDSGKSYSWCNEGDNASDLFEVGLLVRRHVVEWVKSGLCTPQLVCRLAQADGISAAKVDFADLVNDPLSYEGRRISLSARYRDSSEGAYLIDASEVPSHSGDRMRKVRLGGLLDEDDYRKYPTRSQPVTVTGTFHSTGGYPRRTVGFLTRISRIEKIEEEGTRK